MRIRPLIVVAAFGLLGLPPLLAPAQAAERVETARAFLEFSEYVGQEAHAQLQQALDAVVRTALVDQLGGDLDYIRANQKEIAITLGGALEAELASRGFNLLELSLDPGVNTVVNLKLQLAESRIRRIDVRFFILGNSPVIKALTDADAGQIATSLYASISRMPVGNTAWLSRLVRQGVEEQLAGRSAYADFEREVFVEPGEETKVVVVFTPKPDAILITDQQARVHSVTLLRTQVRRIREAAERQLVGLLGAPRSFIQDKQAEVSAAVYRQLVADCSLFTDCPDAALVLGLDTCAVNADLRVESERSLVAASARVDLRSNDGPGTSYGRVRLRGGMVPQPGWTVYGGTDWYPGDDKVYTIAGIGRMLNSKGFIGAGYDFQSQSMRVEAQHELSPDTYLSLDYFGNKNYKRHSEVALHFVTQDAYELQLAASFDGTVFAAVAANY